MDWNKSLTAAIEALAGTGETVCPGLVFALIIDREGRVGVRGVLCDPLLAIAGGSHEMREQLRAGFQSSVAHIFDGLKPPDDRPTDATYIYYTDGM